MNDPDMSDPARTARPVGSVDAALLDAVETDLAGFSGTVALAYQGLTGAAPGARGSMTLNALTPLPAASLIKLPVLACLLGEAAAGRVDLGNRVELRDADRVGGDGLLRWLDAGLRPTLLDLARLMIAVSDNLATNLLIEELGETRLRSWIHDAGLAGTTFEGGLQLPDERRTARQRAGALNRTSAADVTGLLLRLGRAELLPPAATAQMLELLRAQQQTDGIGFALPIDPDVPDDRGRRVRLASKAGALAGASHDAALVHDAAGTPLFVLTVLTSDAADRAEHWRQEGRVRIRRVAETVWRFVSAD